MKRSTSSILGFSKRKTSFLARGITWLLRLLNLRAIGEIADGLFVVSFDSISRLDSFFSSIESHSKRSVTALILIFDILL